MVRRVFKKQILSHFHSDGKVGVRGETLKLQKKEQKDARCPVGGPPGSRTNCRHEASFLNGRGREIWVQVLVIM